MDSDINLHERVAILEIQVKKLDGIEQKLDQLLQLKAQGMGALSLVTVIVGSGAVGIITMLINYFRRNHG